MRNSLRGRLVALLSTAVLLAWLATAVFSYRDARHEIGELLDSQLAHAAELLAGRVADEALNRGEHNGRHGHPPRHGAHEAEKFSFQVWDAAGALLLRSEAAPAERLSPASEGFSDARIDGQHWRVFTRQDAGGRYLVQVAERYDLRDELAESVASHLMHPLVVAVPVLGLLIWLAVGGGLRPLARVAQEVARRDPGNLAPIERAGAPREIDPLLEALNGLFGRVAASLEQERRFTADAAHELRTPLAAIKTQAQVAQAARDDEERRRAIANVVRGADRAARLAEQLLVLSRLDPQTAAPALQQVDLVALARNALAEIAPLAAERGSSVGLHAAGTSTLAAEPTLIAVMLRNLLDNALRYSPAGSAVEVSVVPAGERILLTVADSGPGIAAEERGRVLERFYRVLGSGEEGSGLGLSIVKRIADLHQATLRLREGADGQGLVVEIDFPARN